MERIHQAYPELSVIQLTAWRGNMIFAGERYETQDSGAGYVSDGAVIVHLLKNKIKLPETSVADKEKIISAIEAREKDDKEKKWFFGSTQEEINQQVQMIRTRAAERWLLCFNKCAGA